MDLEWLLATMSLVHFHTANKDLPETGKFTKKKKKKRCLLDLQFHMAGEASQSWWKARRSKSHLTWMAAGKERQSLCRETLIYFKPSDLVKFIHYHEDSTGKTHAHGSVISHWVPPTTCGNYGSFG
uniref:Uncharacterized protein n=1 Tax=Macaca fascicularis TaxID=9541 RepID=A0A7N9CNN9_MACFA